eukprot:TRINITY_DN2259_c0_g1_i4.p1 TRINITY_DN2259_c0_g1~~TRINITY_DN2259_c0_g1_i4.p1  ORF type:complete len:107 (+),score=12.69 TRINITY_DN2259_c0_g1_i4:112-432(+)
MITCISLFMETKGNSKLKTVKQMSRPVVFAEDLAASPRPAPKNTIKNPFALSKNSSKAAENNKNTPLQKPPRKPLEALPKSARQNPDEHSLKWQSMRSHWLSVVSC